MRCRLDVVRCCMRICGRLCRCRDTIVSRELLERCGIDHARFDDLARLANGFLAEPGPAGDLPRATCNPTTCDAQHTTCNVDDLVSDGVLSESAGEPIGGTGGCKEGGQAQAVGCSELNVQQAQMARTILAHCRASYLRANGWEVRLVAYVPASVSAQNTLLLARRLAQ